MEEVSGAQKKKKIGFGQEDKNELFGTGSNIRKSLRQSVPVFSG